VGGILSPGRVRNVPLTSCRQALGPTQPPIEWEPGVLSPGVRRMGHKADHSPPTNAFMAQCLICYAQRQFYLVIYTTVTVAERSKA
jgi:hypothetical protein